MPEVSEPKLKGHAAHPLFSLSELADEWPEIIKIAEKLGRREKLTDDVESWRQQDVKGLLTWQDS
jgi:hypothetical protein